MKNFKKIYCKTNNVKKQMKNKIKNFKKIYCKINNVKIYFILVDSQYDYIKE